MNEQINYDAAADYGLGLSPEIYRAWLVRQRMMEAMARYNSLMISSRDEQRIYSAGWRRKSATSVVDAITTERE